MAIQNKVHVGRETFFSHKNTFFLNCHENFRVGVQIGSVKKSETLGFFFIYILTMPTTATPTYIRFLTCLTLTARGSNLDVKILSSEVDPRIARGKIFIMTVDQ